MIDSLHGAICSKRRAAVILAAVAVILCATAVLSVDSGESDAAPTCTVYFNSNGGSGTMDPLAVESGSSIDPECGFTAPDGNVFAGWSYSRNGTILDMPLTVTHTTMLYATWAAHSSGTTGSCTWTLDGTSLTISGEGAMANYSWSSDRPWGSDITSVIIGEGVNTIGDNAFSWCSDLAIVAIPDSVVTIGTGSFSYCTGLVSVTFGNKVSSIGSFAFNACRSLSSVELPDSVLSIDGYAFEDCTSLGTINLGAGVNKIEDSVFDGCTALTSIAVDTSNPSFASIGGVLFDKDATKLIRYPSGITAASYTIPSKVTEIGSHALIDSVNLSSVTIGGSVSRIDSFAFKDCTKLGSISIPDSVEYIGYSAFDGCSAMTAITIGTGLSSIYESFPDSGDLVSVEVDEGNMFFSSEDGILFNKERTELVLYPSSKTEDSFTVPDTVTTIGSYAFRGSSFLSEVDLGHVTTVESNAFRDCSKLLRLVIPDSMVSIGSWAFDNCSSLVDIEFGNGLERIGSYAFDDCDSLVSVELPDTVLSIGDSAFYGCTSLTTVHLGDGMRSIDRYAFGSCLHIKEIKFGSALRTVDEKAFSTFLTSTVFYDTDQATVLDVNADNLRDSLFRGGSGRLVKIPVYSVTVGDDLLVFNGDDLLQSGTSVYGGTVLKVVVVQHDGTVAKVTPALDDGMYTVSSDTEFSVSYTPVSSEPVKQDTSKDVKASIVVETDSSGRTAGVYLMLVAADDGIIPSGTVTVSYSYTGTQVTPFGQQTVILGDTMSISYIADKAYAYVPLDFSGNQHRADIVGASAVFSDGTNSYRASTVAFAFAED